MSLRTTGRRLSLSCRLSAPNSRSVSTAQRPWKRQPLPPASEADPARLKQHHNDISARYNQGSPTVLPEQIRQRVNKQITHINDAVRAGNVQKLAALWNSTKEGELLQHVQDRVLLPVVQLLHNVTLASSIETASWDPETHHLLLDVSAYTASRDADGSLSQCFISYMLFMLERRDYQAVLDAYQRYLTFSNDLISPETPLDREPIIHPPRIHILLAAVSACAARGSFKEALSLCLSSPHRLQQASTAIFLHKISFSPALQARMRVWAHYLTVARLVANPGSFSRHCGNLGETGAGNQLEHLYSSVMAGIEGPNAYIAASAEQISTQKAVAMTEGGWSALLHAFLSCGRRDLADKLWDDLERLKIPHTITLWTTRIDGHVKDKDYVKAGIVWRMMKSAGVKPDGVAYRAIISAMIQGRRMGEADALFNEFKEGVMKKTSPEVTLAVYNSMISGLLPAHREAALTLLSRMEAKSTSDPPPDVVSYNTVLAFFRQHRDLRGLASTITRMTAAKVTGDVQSFSTILSALVDCGREDAGDMVLSLMQKQGVQANTHTYTSIIKLQMQGNLESIKTGMELLQQMEERQDMPDPSEVTYTTVLAGLARTDALDDRTVDENMKAVVRRMTKRGFELTVRGYNIMIKACLSNMSPEGVRRALSYYQDMQDAKIPIPMSTWYVLLMGLVDREESEVAGRVVADLRATGAKPDENVAELIRRIR